MTDPSLDISAALREAQLQRLESSLASKSVVKYQPQVEVPKDKDEPVRDGPLTVALQSLVRHGILRISAPADVLGRLVVEALVSIALGVLLAWFTTRLIIWFFSPARYERDVSPEDGIR